MYCKTDARGGCGDPFRGVVGMKSKLSVALAALAVGCLANASPASADFLFLNGTVVTGGLFINGSSTNYFDPANGHVGLLNVLNTNRLPSVFPTTRPSSASCLIHKL